MQGLEGIGGLAGRNSSVGDCIDSGVDKVLSGCASSQWCGRLA